MSDMKGHFAVAIVITGITIVISHSKTTTTIIIGIVVVILISPYRSWAVVVTT